MEVSLVNSRGPRKTSYSVKVDVTFSVKPPHSPLSVNNLAEVNSVVHASTMYAEQIVKDSGRGPAFKVALVYSPSPSLRWSESMEKSRTFSLPSAIFLVLLVLCSVSRGWLETIVTKRRVKNMVVGAVMVSVSNYFIYLDINQ